MTKQKKTTKPAGSVGQFVDPKSKEVVHVIPKKGESATDAKARIGAKHGVDPSAIKTE